MLTEDEVEPKKLNNVEDSEQQKRLIIEGASETTRSCDFEVNGLWMIVGTSQEDEQTLYFVKEKEQNQKFVQIKTEMAISQSQKEIEESPGSR